jgi:hypothetical protein
MAIDPVRSRRCRYAAYAADDIAVPAGLVQRSTSNFAHIGSFREVDVTAKRHQKNPSMTCAFQRSVIRLTEVGGNVTLGIWRLVRPGVRVHNLGYMRELGHTRDLGMCVNLYNLGACGRHVRVMAWEYVGTMAGHVWPGM